MVRMNYGITGLVSRYVHRFLSTTTSTHQPHLINLHIQQKEAIQNWGKPKEVADITGLFLRYLNGETSSTPWSDSPLVAETDSIKPHLIKLNSKGWWTVGSQPAIDAAPSGDPIYGWGPRGGYVFQKAFVEFFCTKDDVTMLEARIKSKGGGWITFFASNMVVSRLPLDSYCSMTNRTNRTTL